jgi:hypothetical protein
MVESGKFSGVRDENEEIVTGSGHGNKVPAISSALPSGLIL